MPNIYIESFKTFFSIGLFTLGGGYAMIPLIEKEVVDKHNWMTRQEMVDLIAIAQSCPGVFAINISVFVGYKLRKTRGALCTAPYAALPSFVIILAIAMFFHAFSDNKVVAAVFRGIRPAVVPDSRAHIQSGQKRKGRVDKLLDTYSVGLAIWALGVSPLLIIALAAAGGYLYGQFIKPTEQP